MTTKQNEPRATLFRVGGLGDLLVALPSIALARRRLSGHRLSLVGRAEYAAVLGRAGVVDESLSFDDPRMTAILARDHGAGGGHIKGNNEVGDDSAFELIAAREEKFAALDAATLAMGWWNRSVDWPAEDWWGRDGIIRTCFVTYDRSSGRPMSRFFFDRTMDFFGNSPSPTKDVASDGRGKTAVLGPSDEGRAGKRKATKSGVAGSIKPVAGNEDELFAECARLPFPAALIKTALDALGLSALNPGGIRLVVHPGSGGRAKRWPLPNFIEVIRRAASRGINGVLVTGEAEEDLEPSLNALPFPAGWGRVSRLPVETLAGLLASSTHYIGNDSGPTHLAAACGARVLAFFRDENLPAWRPYGRTRVLSAPSLDRIPLAAALPDIDDFLVF